MEKFNILMKKLFVTSMLLCAACTYSQKTITGLLSANEHTGKIISQYDGNYFWVINNSKYILVDKEGNTKMEDIGMQNTFQPGNNTMVINNGIFADYDKNKLRFRFISIADKKPLTDFVFETIIPYNNKTYFTVKDSGNSKEFIYYDQNLNILYKTSPERIAKQLNLSLADYTRLSISIRYSQKFGSYNDDRIKLYNPRTQKFGYVNSKGTTVIPLKYKKAGDFSEGLAYFKNDNNLYGFINTKGEEVIPAKFSKQPYSFFDNRAKVLSTDGFFGYIDNKGEVIIEPKYRFATNFYKNYALVRKEKFDPILLIDSSGKVMKEFDKELKIRFQEQASTHQPLGLYVEYLTHINPILKQLVDFKKGIFDKGKYLTTGVIDIDGNIVLDFKYKSLKDYHNGLMLAIFNDENKKEKQGLINENGELIVEVKQSQF